MNHFYFSVEGFQASEIPMRIFVFGCRPVVCACIYVRFLFNRSYCCWPITNPFWWLAFRMPMYILQCSIFSTLFTFWIYSLFFHSLALSLVCLLDRSLRLLLLMEINHFGFYAFSLRAFFEFSFRIEIQLYFNAFFFSSLWVAYIGTKNMLLFFQKKKTKNNPATTHKMDDITLFIHRCVCVYFYMCEFVVFSTLYDWVHWIHKINKYMFIFLGQLAPSNVFYCPLFS